MDLDHFIFLTFHLLVHRRTLDLLGLPDVAAPKLALVLDSLG